MGYRADKLQEWIKGLRWAVEYPSTWKLYIREQYLRHFFGTDAATEQMADQVFNLLKEEHVLVPLENHVNPEDANKPKWRNKLILNPSYENGEVDVSSLLMSADEELSQFLMDDEWWPESKEASSKTASTTQLPFQLLDGTSKSVRMDGKSLTDDSVRWEFVTPGECGLSLLVQFTIPSEDPWDDLWKDKKVLTDWVEQHGGLRQIAIDYLKGLKPGARHNVYKRYMDDDLLMDMDEDLLAALMYDMSFDKTSSAFKFKQAKRLTATRVYHGGNLNSGSERLVTYYTPNREMAESYVDMSDERFGEGDNSVTEHDIVFRKPARWEDVEQDAEMLDMETDYTPASVFDVEIQDPEKVRQLIRILKAQGFDGAILEDIAYGRQIQDLAYIVFN